MDDDDVDGYISSIDKEQCRSALNVEVIQCKGQVLMEESSVGVKTSVGVKNSVGVNNEDSNGGANDNAMILYDEPERNDGLLEDGENVDENGMLSWNENVFRDEFIELPCDEEGQQFVGDWEDGIGLEIGQEFVAKEQVQNLLLRASLKECYDFNVLNSDSWRYVIRCCAEGCDWYLRAQFLIDEIWSVKKYRRMHSCSCASGSTSGNNKKKGTPQLVADVIHEEFPGVMKTLSAKLLMDLVLSKVGVKVSYETALRGKHLAASIIRGSPEDSYKKLPSYLYVLEKRNVGTKTKLLVDKEDRFKYVFIALGACIKGFSAMRKFISVDATFLKYGGVLIFAMAQDPNRHHYPIAFDVVDGETDASWDWFFRQLLTDKEDLVFVSDRNASLIKAVAEVYKKCSHGFCVYHLSQNVRGRAPGGSKEYVGKKFRELGVIYTTVEFDKEYADFRKRFPTVAEYLDKNVPIRKWARSYFKGERYNIETTNMSESMNNVFKKARMYALLPMIDAIVGKISQWFNKHRKDSNKVVTSQKMVPFVENELHHSCKIGSKLKVVVLNVFLREFSVIGLDGKSYDVNLRSFTCSCKHFDKDKYPCVHAVAAVLVYGKIPERIVDLNVYDLCSDLFKLETWALAYCETIYTVPHESQWQVSDAILSKMTLPPDYPKKRGRNKENRYRSAGEVLGRRERRVTG